MDLNILIVGGGIHGVGLLHDLAARKIHGVHLVERKKIASGTSSRSTKLVHGGLRYLEHLGQWGLVHEALTERSLLLKLLPEIVKPLPFILPNFKHGKRPAWMARMGLFFYDLLAGDSGMPAAQVLKKEDILKLAPYLDRNKVETEMTSAFLYYDAQMLDDVIARIIAQASVKLGATYEENAEVISVKQIENGFKVQILSQGIIKTLTTRYVINAAGAWCNDNLLKWDFIPNITCLLNLGTHIVFNPEVIANPENSPLTATLIQENDGRVVFFIPWYGKWLFGTTESILHGQPSSIHPLEEDKKYLMQTAERVLNLQNAEKNISEIFSGVRCMPLRQRNDIKRLNSNWQADPFLSPFYVRELDKNISSLSRETVINQIVPGLISIYGGKYTTYRAVSEKIGSKLSHKLMLGSTPKTHLAESWFLSEIKEEMPEIFLSSPELRQM